MDKFLTTLLFLAILLAARCKDPCSCALAFPESIQGSWYASKVTHHAMNNGFNYWVSETYTDTDFAGALVIADSTIEFFYVLPEFTDTGIGYPYDSTNPNNHYRGTYHVEGDTIVVESAYWLERKEVTRSTNHELGMRAIFEDPDTLGTTVYLGYSALYRRYEGTLPPHWWDVPNSSQSKTRPRIKDPVDSKQILSRR